MIANHVLDTVDEWIKKEKRSDQTGNDLHECIWNIAALRHQSSQGFDYLNAKKVYLQ